MKDKKGFTLIELLAVIVILAIIVLIATPLILGVIEDSRKKSLETSAYGIIKAGEILLSKNTNELTTLDITKTKSRIQTEWSDLEYKGTDPDEGRLFISAEGKAQIVIIKDKLCASNLETKDDKVKSYTIGKDDNGFCDMNKINNPDAPEIGNYCNEQTLKAKDVVIENGIITEVKGNLKNIKVPRNIDGTEIKGIDFKTSFECIVFADDIPNDPDFRITTSTEKPEGYNIKLPNSWTKLHTSLTSWYPSIYINKLTLPQNLATISNSVFGGNKTFVGENFSKYEIPDSLTYFDEGCGFAIDGIVIKASNTIDFGMWNSVAKKVYIKASSQAECDSVDLRLDNWNTPPEIICEIE